MQYSGESHLLAPIYSQTSQSCLQSPALFTFTWYHIDNWQDWKVLSSQIFSDKFK